MGLRQFIFAITIIFLTLRGSHSFSQEVTPIPEQTSSYIWLLEDTYGGCSVAMAYTHEGLRLPINPERCEEGNIDCAHPLARIFLQSSRQIYTELNPEDMSLFRESIYGALPTSSNHRGAERELAQKAEGLETTGDLFKDSIDGLQYLGEFLESPYQEVAGWNYLRTYIEIVNKLKKSISLGGKNITGSFDEDLFAFAEFYRTGLYSLDDPINHLGALESQLRPESLVRLVEEMMMSPNSLVESSSVFNLLSQRSRLYAFFQRGVLSLLEGEYRKYDNFPQMRVHRNENWARVIANNHLHQIDSSDLVSYTGGVFHFLGEGNLIEKLEGVHRFKTRALSIEDADLILNYLRDNNKIRLIETRYDRDGDGTEEVFMIEALDRMRHEGFPANQVYCFKDVLDNR